jgi:hypothetical protein
MASAGPVCRSDALERSRVAPDWARADRAQARADWAEPPEPGPETPEPGPEPEPHATRPGDGAGGPDGAPRAAPAADLGRPQLPSWLPPHRALGRLNIVPRDAARTSDGLASSRAP